MAITQAPTVALSITGTRSNAADLQTAAVSLAKTYSQAFTNGTGNAQVDLIYSDTITLTTGAASTLDLTALTDEAFGTTLAFAKVRAIIIYSTLAANKQLVVGGGSNPFITWLNATGDGIKIDPLGLFVLTNPNAAYAVTGDTGDILTITNASGGSTTYDIWIFGTSS